jgi:hypothetical protein
MRFTSNGHPGRLITVLEYDSTFSWDDPPSTSGAANRMPATRSAEATRRNRRAFYVASSSA